MKQEGQDKGVLRTSLTVGAFGAMAAAAATALTLRRTGGADDAPGRTARGGDFGNYAVIGKTVTINRPRAELFAFWRDFSNLPEFMENIEAVEPLGGDASLWRIKAPAGMEVAIKTEIVEEREDELIAWRSTEGSSIDSEGRVKFRDAPAGRGTELEAIIAYKPPGGRAGRLIAKLFQREPEMQARRDLKRFKMLMETGEIATSDRRRNDEGG
ncbi:MAG: SRPBCC family protein [Parasphingopyxis sp.]|uniref:SRPBCC family protein n=1 Tax=Parasphingopyxis sp. TaxID=1920299 RepID=UPI0032EAF099